MLLLVEPLFFMGGSIKSDPNTSADFDWWTTLSSLDDTSNVVVAVIVVVAAAVVVVVVVAAGGGVVVVAVCGGDDKFGDRLREGYEKDIDRYNKIRNIDKQLSMHNKDFREWKIYAGYDIIW